MRYYDIAVTKKGGGLYVPSSFNGLALTTTWPSQVNGQPLSAALNIELDVPVYPFAQPRQSSYLRVWGISFSEMQNAGQLNGAGIVVKAGMQKGLPLANPAQSGVIINGTIFQCFGNWRGTDMTLDMMLAPSTGTNDAPVDLGFSWPANTPIGGSGGPLFQTLTKAFPAPYTVQVAISSDIVFPNIQTGKYKTLPDFAIMLRKLTLGSQFAGIATLGGGKYPGIDISIRDNIILAYDNTVDHGGNTFANPKQIAFQDLVGQPTWITPQSINFSCVMRSDIQVGDYVQMPVSATGQGLQTPFVLTAPGAAFPGTAAANKSAFTGKFYILEAHHWGNFRALDAGAWVTTYDAAFVNTGS